MNKRGINEIITTVLLILLLLAGISIVWIFVRNNISSTGEQVDAQTSLAQTKFSIVQNSLINKDNNLTFFLERNSGGKDIEGVIIIVEDNKGNTSTVRKYNQTRMTELQRIIINITIQEHGLLGNVTKISVFPVITTNGKSLISDKPAVVTTIQANSRNQNGNAQICGNLIIEQSEQCDGNSQTCIVGNNYTGTQSCNPTCNGFNSCITTLSCGDGMINGTEQCDDNNALSGDGCSLSCQIEFLSLTTCQQLNQPGKTYKLINDVQKNTTCFTISASNIVLNGDNKTAKGNQSSGSCGILVSSNVKNITITNVSVVSYQIGIYLNTNSTANINNNFLLNNSFYGIYLFSSSNNLVTNNKIANSQRGLYMISLNNTVNNNFACYNSIVDVQCTGSNNTGTGNIYNRTLGCTGANVIQNISSCP